MARTRTAVDDPGLAEIRDWHIWFVEAHRKRLRDDGHDDASVEDLMVPILAQADAITTKQVEDYLIWQRRRT